MKLAVLVRVFVGVVLCWSWFLFAYFKGKQAIKWVKGGINMWKIKVFKMHTKANIIRKNNQQRNLFNY